MIEKRKVTLEALEPRGAWQAFLMPTLGFPVAPAERLTLLAFATPLMQSLHRSNYDHTVFLQAWKLGKDTGSSLIADHNRDWRPQVGLGMWPDRPAPTSWTEELMMDASAAVIRGDEPELPWHPLLRLRPNVEGREAAESSLRGFGAQIDVFSTSAVDDLLRSCDTYYRPRIQGDRFRDEAFYLPLLDRRSFERATANDLDQCMCGIDFYLRESPEDRAVFVLSRLPLRQILENAGLAAV